VFGVSLFLGGGSRIGRLLPGRGRFRVRRVGKVKTAVGKKKREGSGAGAVSREGGQRVDFETAAAQRRLTLASEFAVDGRMRPLLVGHL